MRYYNSMKELIGNTPLVRLSHLGVKPGVNLFAKLELYNPAGSIKDRTATYMIENAEKKGELHKGSTIIEATAGNMGIGIAFAALNRGYKVLFVVPKKFSSEKQAIMRALGAKIIHTPSEEGMLGAIRKADEIKKETKGAVSLGQFVNASNPQAHYETTGPEIYKDLDGDVDYVVAGAGSGGTITGVLRYIKEHNPFTRGILADPVGSTIGGGEHSDYNIEGIGNNFVADTMDISLIDRVIKVNDEQAFSAVHEVALKEGIVAGSSSGAALHAALKVASEIEHGNIVAIFPDRGERYFSKGLF